MEQRNRQLIYTPCKDRLESRNEGAATTALPLDIRATWLGEQTRRTSICADIRQKLYNHLHPTELQRPLDYLPAAVWISRLAWNLAADGIPDTVRNYPTSSIPDKRSIHLKAESCPHSTTTRHRSVLALFAPDMLAIICSALVLRCSINLCASMNSSIRTTLLPLSSIWNKSMYCACQSFSAATAS
jgi:hypothetical protein